MSLAGLQNAMQRINIPNLLSKDVIGRFVTSAVMAMIHTPLRGKT